MHLRVSWLVVAGLGLSCAYSQTGWQQVLASVKAAVGLIAGSVRASIVIQKIRQLKMQ